MIITLNLISPQQRRRLRVQGAIKESRSLSVTILYVVLLVTAIMIYAKNLLQNMSEIFQNNTTPLANSITVNDADKDTAQKISASLKDSILWSDFLVTFAKVVPSDVIIHNIDIGADGSLTISGQAPKRESLLNLQNNLTSSGLIKNLYSPVKNLLQSSNINFELTAQLISAPDAKKTKS